jgi:catechol 2,3-dioxygenase-like lactoylglutathione lyase family enzyme
MITGISAVTLATHDMKRAVQFYRLLGLPLVHGGEDAGFTSFRAGDNFLNLIAQPTERRWSWWGRLIFFTTPMSTRSMSGWSPPGSTPTPRPATRHGASTSFTSPTPTDMS